MTEKQYIHTAQAIQYVNSKKTIYYDTSNGYTSSFKRVKKSEYEIRAFGPDIGEYVTLSCRFSQLIKRLNDFGSENKLYIKKRGNK